MLRGFLEGDSLAFSESRFTDKPSTLAYCRFGLKGILAFAQLADARLDELTAEKVNGFAAVLRESTVRVAKINRMWQVIRRTFKLAQELGITDRLLPRLRMQPGENRRVRVLTADEEVPYLGVAQTVGDEILGAYSKAVGGIRATELGEQPIPSD
jgi:hypothetical protein